MKNVILLLIIFFTSIIPTVNSYAAKGAWDKNVRTRSLTLSPPEIYTESNSLTIHLKDALQNILMWKHYFSRIYIHTCESYNSYFL